MSWFTCDCKRCQSSSDYNDSSHRFGTGSNEQQEVHNQIFWNIIFSCLICLPRKRFTAQVTRRRFTDYRALIFSILTSPSKCWNFLENPMNLIKICVTSHVQTKLWERQNEFSLFDSQLQLLTLQLFIGDIASGFWQCRAKKKKTKHFMVFDCIGLRFDVNANELEGRAGDRCMPAMPGRC